MRFILLYYKFLFFIPRFLLHYITFYFLTSIFYIKIFAILRTLLTETKRFPNNRGNVSIEPLSDYLRLSRRGHGVTPSGEKVRSCCNHQMKSQLGQRVVGGRRGGFLRLDRSTHHEIVLCGTARRKSAAPWDSLEAASFISANPLWTRWPPPQGFLAHYMSLRHYRPVAADSVPVRSAYT